MKTSAALRRALLPIWARYSGLHSLNSRSLAAQPRLGVAAARPLSFFGYKLRARPGPENLSVVPVSASSPSPTAEGRLAREPKVHFGCLLDCLGAADHRHLKKAASPVAERNSQSELDRALD